MEKLKINAHYLAVLVCLVILVSAGSYFIYNAYHPSEKLHQTQQQDLTPQPTPVTSAPVQLVSPAVPVTGSTQEPGAVCNISTGPRALVPVDTSVPIQDPMPGIRYSLNESDSDRTIVLDKGEMVEINLRWRPGHGLHWIVPVSGCGLELVNDGYYDTGTDFWNTSGHYRARYRAVGSGTSVLNGEYLAEPKEVGNLRFNLTVIVK
jgi:predicted secreted protein